MQLGHAHCLFPVIIFNIVEHKENSNKTPELRNIRVIFFFIVVTVNAITKVSHLQLSRWEITVIHKVLSICLLFAENNRKEIL